MHVCACARVCACMQQRGVHNTNNENSCLVSYAEISLSNYEPTKPYEISQTNFGLCFDGIGPIVHT